MEPIVWDGQADRIRMWAKMTPLPPYSDQHGCLDLRTSFLPTWQIKHLPNRLRSALGITTR